MHPRAIETRYKGYRFRSRLEARWAVFFDALGLRWEYEPEGFELPSGRYLPDFFVHWDAERGKYLQQFSKVGYWVEIKGNPPTAEELQKLGELAVGTKHHAYLFSGDVGAAAVFNAELETGRVRQCPSEDERARQYFTLLSAVVCLCRKAGHPSWEECQAALEAARSARFEHGESGPRGGRQA